MSAVLRTPEHFESGRETQIRVPGLTLRDEQDASPRLTVIRGRLHDFDQAAEERPPRIVVLLAASIVLFFFLFIGVKAASIESGRSAPVRVERPQAPRALAAKRVKPVEITRKQPRAMAILALAMLPYQPNIIYRSIDRPHRGAKGRR